MNSPSIAKTVSLILALLLASTTAGALASCGNGAAPADGTSTTAADATTANPGDPLVTTNDRDAIRDELPEADFGGYKFRILNVENSDLAWLVTDIDAKEEKGETINDAIYKRNRTVEAKYNFTIEETRMLTPANENAAAKKSIKAGSDDYDLVMTANDQINASATEGLFEDLFGMPRIDLTKPWWDQAQIRDFQLNHHLYFACGDLSISHYSSTMVMFFNKQLIRDYNLDDPYQLVRGNQWTFDKFYDLAKHVSRDIDGNGQWDKNDQYGYMSLNFLIVPAWMNASAQPLIKLDEAGQPQFMANTGLFADVFTKLVDIMYADNILYDADKHGNHRDQDIMFPGGQVLFWTELVHWSKLLRDMETDFGIIPIPKYSSEQKDWYCYTFGPTYICVPVTVTDRDRMGHILEALCAEGYRTTVPAYYDAMLKTKISRDNDSGDMLDLIFTNRVYDLGYYYWNTQAGTPLVSLFKNQDTGIASYVDKNAAKVQAAIDKTMEALGK